MLFKREKYLSKIRPFYKTDMIKVISGIRRSGKSCIMLNRGQAVNLRHVKSLNGDSMTLDDGTAISVSKARLPELSGCLERYWCSEANKKKN